MNGKTEASNAVEYSVSEISQAVKHTLEQAYGYVRVRGEIGRISRPASGHVYFDLKDDKAVIAAVSWRGLAKNVSHLLDQGLEVVATGRISSFPGSSKYQLIVEAVEPAGVGALMALFEARKKALEARGLFDNARKLPLPFLPKTIGVVTSPTGAVIRDILHRLADRFPRDVLIWPVRVQGSSSAAEVAAAITGFNQLSTARTAAGELDGIAVPDVLIIARGGGSLEELWGYNEEIVAEAAAQSNIPIISAIGHETDWTLLDFVADRRAPTPSAAAEMVVPVRRDLKSRVADLGHRQNIAVDRIFAERRSALRAAHRGLPCPSDIIANLQQSHDGVSLRLDSAIRSQVTHVRAALTLAHRGLPPIQRLTWPLQQKLTDNHARLRYSFTTILRRHRQQIERYGIDRTMPLLTRKLSDRTHALSLLAGRLQHSHSARLERVALRLDNLGKLMVSLSHRSILTRGYALIRGKDDAILRHRNELIGGAQVTIELQDGSADAIIGNADSTSTDAAKNPARADSTSTDASHDKTRKRGGPTDDSQGQLF